MSKTDSEQDLDNSDEISLKEFIMEIKRWSLFILSQWKIILIAGIIGGILGIVHAWTTKPTYKAELSFVVENNDKSSGGGISGALASSLGMDLLGGGSSAGGEFSGDNLLAFMKSRSMVEKALLTTENINGRKTTLVEYYIDFNKIRQGWQSKPELRNIHFLPDADRSKFTLKQDSVLGAFHKAIIKDNLVVNKLDKNLSIIALSVESKNELFSKYFTEVLATVVSDFYIQTKTEKGAKNVAILQRQTDSVRFILNNAISGVAMSADLNPNPNPSLQSLRVPSQRRQVDVQTNTAIFNGLVGNLEGAKMSLLQATPLIQVIDRPILPLEKKGPGRAPSGIIWGTVFGFLAVIYLVFKKKLADLLK